MSMSVMGQDAQLQQAFKSSYEKEKEGDLTSAISTLMSLYDESSYELNIRLGWLHYSAGQFTESLAYYSKAMALMPASIEARLGYVYPAAALGNWEQVKRQYEKILSIDPKNTVAHYRLGMIHYGREEFDKAMNHFQMGSNLYPFDYDFNLMLAWTHLRMGKVREAKVLFNKVLLIAPDDASALEGLAQIK